MRENISLNFDLSVGMRVHFLPTAAEKGTKRAPLKGKRVSHPLRHPLPLKDPSHHWHRDFIRVKNFVFGVSEKGYLSYG